MSTPNKLKMIFSYTIGILTMNLCKCGCGKEVTNDKNVFRKGHNRPMLGQKFSVDSVLHMSIAQKLNKEKKREAWKNHTNLQKKEIEGKKIQANLKTRGVSYPQQSKEVKEKSQLTCFKNNGVLFPTQCEKIKEKAKETSRLKYGKDYWMQSQIGLKKFKSSMLKIHNVLNPMHIDEVKEKKKLTTKDKFGEIYWSKTNEGRTFYRINAIKFIEDQKLHGEPLMPRIGIYEREALNELQLHTHLKILRQDHSFIYIIGRIPDGYIKESNLIILFHERNGHYLDDECTTETEDTIRTTKDYESLGLTVFKISEKDWKENKNKTILDFKELKESPNAK